jgi:hypothetical protein
MKTQGLDVKISDFSPHLFWDVNRNELDFDKNRKIIVSQVLQYGLFEDWVLVCRLYTMKEIADVAVSIRDLDKKSLSFISLVTNTPKEQFACFTSNQSMPKHWNF